MVGGIIGALLGLLTHAATGGRRDFSSITSVQAQRYDLLAEVSVAEQIERALAELPPYRDGRSGPTDTQSGQPASSLP